MKKLLAVTLILVLGTAMSASAIGGIKTVQLGVKAGLTSENTEIKRTHNFDSRDKLGWHLGLQSRVNFMFVHIQPEILFSFNNYTIDTPNSGKYKAKLRTVDVPIMVGTKFLFFRAQAGPVFNLMTDEKVNRGLEMMFDRPTVGYAIGVGADLSSFTLDVRYNGQFKHSKQTISGSTYKTSLNSWQFSLGYMF